MPPPAVSPVTSAVVRVVVYSRPIVRELFIRSMQYILIPSTLEILLRLSDTSEAHFGV